MGALQEQEIFDCLKTNLRLAAQSCDTLAVSPRKGPTYVKLRTELRLVEGACRQAGFWRGGDARWLTIGRLMADANKHAGDWLRGTKQPNGGRVKTSSAQMFYLFSKLAENLRAAYVKAEEFRTMRTNRTGPVLPVVLPPPHRDTRPSGYNCSPGGILMPTASMVQ